MAATVKGRADGPGVALCTIAFREKLLDDALDIARCIGFEAVELWGREPHVAEAYDYNRTRLIKQKCEERRLTIAALGSYLRFGATRKNSATADLRNILQTAYTLRAPIIRVWASDVGSAEASPQIWKKTVAEAREACQRCQKLGITLAVEMHDNTLADTADSTLRLIEEVGCDNFRVNYQPSAIEGMEDPIQRLEKVLPYVVHCHAQNFSCLGRPDGVAPQRSSLREGLIDYREIVERLLAADFKGWIAVEFAHTEGDGKFAALAEDLEYLTELLSSS